MKKLYRILFLGGGGGNFPGGFISGGHFSRGIFPGGIFPSTVGMHPRFIFKTKTNFVYYLFTYCLFYLGTYKN